MKRNKQKIEAKRATLLKVQTIAKIFEYAYMQGVTHFDANKEWKPEDTQKMQAVYNEFMKRQTPAEKKSPIILPPNIIKQ